MLEILVSLVVRFSWLVSFGLGQLGVVGIGLIFGGTLVTLALSF